MRVRMDCVAKVVRAAAVLLACVASPASGGIVYFLVAEPDGNVVHGDSFVLPLTDSNDITDARRQIAHPDESSIVVAQIAVGADGINRDHLASSRPVWSWHVTRFEDFAFSTIELLDGWPTFVEQDLDGWLRNTNSRIGFWSYRVVAEVDASGEPAVPLPPAAFSAGAVGLAVLAFFVRPSSRARVVT